MNDDDNFLARWSQRKREARQPPTEQVSATEAETLVEPAEETVSEKPFDLSALPKLDEITGSTDITAFLQKGIPDSLRNAVLRKAWALDPAIRNYVNPALEYAYDWNVPGGVPGTGELAAGTDLVRAIAQIMGGGSSDELSAERASDPANVIEDCAEVETPEQLPMPAVRLSDEQTGTSESRDMVAQAAQTGLKPTTATEEKTSTAPQHSLRRHGSAAPRF